MILFGTIFYCWLWNQLKVLFNIRLQYTLKQTDLILSSLHAGIITAFHGARLLGYHWWGPSVFVDWGMLHLLVYSLILGYCYTDTYDLWYHPRYEGKTKEKIVWTLHHACLALPTLIFGWIFLTGDMGVEWWATIGYLAESSTLPLNLSKWLHYKGIVPSRWFNTAFLAIYFISRPLNFTGLVWYSWKTFGWRFWKNATGISVYLAVILALMNWYWFYMLYQKIARVEKARAKEPVLSSEKLKKME